MKTLIYAFAIALLFAGCKKDERIASNSIIGTWIHTDDFWSPGNAPTWHPATENPRLYVNFKTDGKLEGSAFAKDFISYAVRDSVTISFTKPDKTLFNYRYVIKNDTLTMSPTSVICFEGCAIRFVRE